MHPEALRSYFTLRNSRQWDGTTTFKPSEAWAYAMARHKGLRWRAQLAKLVPVRTDC